MNTINLSTYVASAKRHRAGIILVVLSAIVFSSAGLFTKGVMASAWEIIFWRGLFAILFTTIYALWRGPKDRRWANFANIGGSGVAVGLVGALGTAAYIPALKLTTIANVSLIYAVTPLLAAALAWLWVKERMSSSAVVGCLAAIAGVGVIVSGSLGGIHLAGDLLTLAMSIAIAVMLVIYRKYPNTPAAGPAVLSSLILLPIALIFGNPFGNSAFDIFVTAIFGLAFAFASVTLAEGSKRLPSGETALLSLLEMPLAPVLAYLAFRELPHMLTYAGGALIVFGIVISQMPQFSAQPAKVP